ncbi:hypothetical protein MUP35_03405 [Patescibacteria group bacterium]|nr:hypothetical protein [Patescibacteria group bacterium]
MLFKGFLAFFVVLFSVCLIILIFYLSYLPEARFDLNENKAFDGVNLECSFTLKDAIVFSSKENKTYTPLGGGFLRVITNVCIQENKWGEELVVKTRPFWISVLLFCFSIIFLTVLVLREIFRRRI